MNQYKKKSINESNDKLDFFRVAWQYFGGYFYQFKLFAEEHDVLIGSGWDKQNECPQFFRKNIDDIPF